MTIVKKRKEGRAGQGRKIRKDKRRMKDEG